MQFTILNRFSGEVQITAEIDCDESASHSLKLGLAVKWAVKNKADLSSADLRFADLSSADLSSADLRFADLSSANLSFANLSFADLSSADLRFADLSSANLSSADLSSANLSFANLSFADLSSADLSSADLSSANLRFADLSSANLSFANLSSANLSSADLSFLKGCKWAQVAFHSHGECGRQLSAVVIDGVTVFFCGCFKGSREQLEEYIAGGKEEFRASRTKAMQAVISLLDA